MEGDELQEVNGQRVTGKAPDEVISILVGHSVLFLSKNINVKQIFY